MSRSSPIVRILRYSERQREVPGTMLEDYSPVS